MDYGRLMVRSFEITRRYRALWVFGFLLAIFGGGTGTEWNFGLSGGGGGGRGGNAGPRPSVPPVSVPDWVAPLVLGIICVAACVFVIWIVLSIVLRFVCRAALINSVQELEASQITPTARHAFQVGLNRFWPLLGIALVINVPLALLWLVLLLIAVGPLLVAILPLIGSNSGQPTPDMTAPFLSGLAGSFALLCCGAILLFLIGIAIDPFYQFITRVCVVDKRGVTGSIAEGYRLVRANLGGIVLLYLLVIGLRIGFLIISGLLALLLFGIPAVIGWLSYWVANSAAAGVVVGLIVLIPMLVVLIFVFGLYQVYESTLWTEGFLETRSAAAPTTPAPVPPEPPTVPAPQTP
jgi:hypothetical protein